MGKVEAICISKKKGERKHAVKSGVFLEDTGIKGDAHAGAEHRQISLLSAVDIDAFRNHHDLEIKPGDFAENAVISGLELSDTGLGSRLRLGTKVVLEISQIGKACHSPCAIKRLTGECIMPQKGLFARVKTSGTVRTGDTAELIDIVPRSCFQVVVLTISDRCFSGKAQDTAGPAVAAAIRKALGAHIYRTNILPDEQSTITERLKHYSDDHSIDLVVTVGGTGFSPRDITPEATRSVIGRLTPGLDEAMRAASLAQTPHAMLSRGVSGIRNKTLIINFPGSERAAVENCGAILPALRHGLEKLRGDPSDCGRLTDAARQMLRGDFT